MQIQALSFTLDDDDEDEAAASSADDSDAEICELPVKKKIRKNPDVDTSFLPDREREDEENKLREELRQVCNLFGGSGGAEVACWPLVPKFAGSNPAEAVGFLKGDERSSARLP